MSSRLFAPALLALSLIAFATSLAYALLVSPHEQLAGDAGLYHALGSGLAHGDGYSTLASLVHPPHRPTSEHPPLFPLFVAGLDELGLTSLGAQRAAACLLAAAAVALIGLLGRRLAGPRAGLIAAGVAAVYPNFFVLPGMAMVESLYVPLIALALLLAYAVIARPTALRCAALGATIGAATLARTEAVLLIALLGIPVALRAPGIRWRTLTLLTAAALLVLTPWLARNAAAQHKFPLLSTNGGLTALVANCDNPYYRQVGFFDPTCVRACEGIADEVEQSECGSRRARAYARRHAGRVPLVVLARQGRTWNLYAQGKDLSYAQFGGRSRVAGTAGLLLYLLLLPLGVAGAVVLVRRGVTPLPLLAPFAMVVLATAAAYGFSRYRVAAEVPLVALASVGIDALVSGTFDGRLRKASATSSEPQAA
jgi:4-amino-4-deoxy-L-arabinose transferase-like glycosyltransferase